jgi:hypothetical protein
MWRHYIHAARESGRTDKKAEFWSENLKGRDHVEDLGVVGKVILEWILGK